MFEIMGLIVGGAIGFLSAVLAEPIRTWLFSPKLVLEYDEKGGSKLLTTGQHARHDTEFCYLRIRVTNKSITRRIARNCVAYLVDVKQEKKGAESAEQFVDSLPMPWSERIKGMRLRMEVGDPPPPEERIDIPCGLGPFFDILFTIRGENQFCWRFACGEPPPRYRPLTNQIGDLILTLMVSAENTAPATIRLRFTWRGDWQNFDVRELPSGPRGEWRKAKERILPIAQRVHTGWGRLRKWLMKLP